MTRNKLFPFIAHCKLISAVNKSKNNRVRIASHFFRNFSNQQKYDLPLEFIADDEMNRCVSGAWDEQSGGRRKGGSRDAEKAKQGRECRG